MYARVVIAQTTGPDQTEELRPMFLEHIRLELIKNVGSVGANFMVEEGSNMVTMITYWSNLEKYLTYYSGGAYRGFAAKAERLLIGSLVVRSFIRIDTMEETVRHALKELGLGYLEDDASLELALIEAQQAFQRILKAKQQRTRTARL